MKSDNFQAIGAPLLILFLLLLLLGSVGAATENVSVGVGSAVLVGKNTELPQTIINPVGAKRRVIDAPIVTDAGGSAKYWFISTYNTLTKYTGSLESPLKKILWSKPIKDVLAVPTGINKGAAYWVVNTYSEKSAPEAPSPYVFSKGYSDTQEKNQWSYQYKDTTGYVPMVWDIPSWGGTNKVWKGKEAFPFITKTSLHPGKDSDAVIKWVATEPASLKITGTVADANSKCGDGVIAKILKNDTTLWRVTIANGGASQFHDLSTQVSTGDAIYFVVEKNLDSNCDSTKWNPTIAPQSFPGMLAFVHVEFPRFVNNEYFSGKGKIGLAWSEDHGEHFTYLGNILTPYGDPNDFNVQGLPYITKDGYFYVYYKDACANNRRTAVARAPIKDVLSAARKGQVSPWKKYSDGDWKSNGDGGSCTGIDIESGIIHTDAAYSTYDKKYYMTQSTMNWSGKGTWIKLYQSTDGITWKVIKTIAEDLNPEREEGYQYVSIINKSGSDNGVVGRQFYIYSATDPINNASLYRWLINLNTPATESASATRKGLASILESMKNFIFSLSSMFKN